MGKRIVEKELSEIQQTGAFSTQSDPEWEGIISTLGRNNLNVTSHVSKEKRARELEIVKYNIGKQLNQSSW